MNLIELLTPEEKEMIGTYIDLYAFESNDGRRSASVEEVLRIWNRSKQGLYNLFQGNLILKKQVEFKKSEDYQTYRMSNELSDYPFFDNLSNAAFDYFYLKIGDLSTYQLLKNQFCCFGPNITRNIYDGPTFAFKTPSGETFKIQNGCKMMKTLGKLAEIFQVDGYEDFRIAHSQILNDNDIKGTLCLSIHPLDFMTMSDNKNGWESCMSWRNYGCYRQGTVEMMNSKNVIVAYLESETKNLSIFPGKWNSKKWRELYIVDNDIIANIKGYPYQDENLSKEVLNWLRELAWQAGYDGYYEDFASCDGSGAFQYPVDSDDDDKIITITMETNNMYNDFYNDPKAFAYISKYFDYGETYTLNYSGVAECMGCGDVIEYSGDTNALVCNDCEPTFICYECGSMSHDESEMIEMDGHYYCPCCAEEYLSINPITGNYQSNNNLVSIYLVSEDEEVYYPDAQIEIDYEWFYNNSKLEDPLSTIRTGENIKITPYENIGIKTSQLTDRGKEIFGFYGYETDEIIAELVKNYYESEF
jgi:hypothetical protein